LIKLSENVCKQIPLDLLIQLSVLIKYRLMSN